VTAPAPKGGLVRQALTENIGLKLLALAASIGLFVIVRGTTDEPGVVDVDVVALPPSPDSPRMLISQVPTKVRVTLRGSESVLESVRREGLPDIQIDLRDPNQHFYTFDPDEIEVRAGLTVEHIAPPAIPLTWVDRADARAQVVPTLEGELRDGLTVVSRTVEPRRVHVRGAAPELTRLSELRTTPIDISGLGPGTHDEAVSLAQLPPHVEYVDTPSVTVRIVIEEEEGVRTFRELEVSVVGAAEASTRPAQVNVVVSGPRARVDALDPIRFVPYVDATTVDLTRGAVPVPVHVRGVPEGLRAVAEPSEVLFVPPRVVPQR
jgi:YbbR domain-containing protein